MSQVQPAAEATWGRPDRCRVCRILMVPARRYGPKYRHTHSGRGLCRLCYDRERAAGRLQQWSTVSGRRCRQGMTCAFCEDVEFLAENGTSVDEWPSRLNTTAGALSRRLYRHNRHDLASRVDRAHRRYRERVAA